MSSPTRQTLFIRPEDAFRELPSVLETDPRHVYPLLVMVAENSRGGLVFFDNHATASIPKHLTTAEARQLIDFAFDPDGNYRGVREFERRLQLFARERDLHEEKAVLLYVRATPQSGSATLLEIVTGDDDIMCGVDAASSFEMMGEIHPISRITVETMAGRER